MQKKSKQLLVYFLVPLGIFILNVFLIVPLFKGGYTQFMGSIEAARISDAKWIYENFKDIEWNYLWYMGFPFHLTYFPVFPYLIAFSHTLFKSVSFPSIYRILTAFFYCLGPVNLYFFMRYLTKKISPALFTALIYTLPSYLIIFIPGVKEEIIPNLVSWNLLVMLKYGEGSHIASLSLVPLAALIFMKSLKEPSFKKYVLTAFLSALILLTNILTFFALIIMFLVILFSEATAGGLGKKFSITVKIFLLTFGLSAFWYNFSFLKVYFLFGNNNNLIQNLLSLFPFAIIVVPVLAMIISTFFSKRPKLQPFFIGLFWCMSFFVMVGSWVYFEKIFVPQPFRFVVEFNLSLAVMIGLIYWILSNKIELFSKILSLIFGIAVTGLLIYLNLHFVRNNWKIVTGNKKITQTSEYQVSKWLSENTNGERVYATGSTGFWLNVFSNVPQIRGGSDGAPYSQWWAHATHQINTSENAPKGKEGEITLNWLKTLNASYAVVNFPESREIYHDYKNPSKFNKIEGLKKVYDQDGDVIYKILLTNPSLVQIVSKQKFKNLRIPYNAVDSENLQNYVDYIEDSNLDQEKINLVSKKNTEYEISANLKENEAIGLQVSYNPGWRAYIDGKQVKIQKDPIGLMFIDPQKTGDVKVILQFRKSWDQYLGYLITTVTLLGLIYVPFRRRRQNEQTKK